MVLTFKNFNNESVKVILFLAFKHISTKKKQSIVATLGVSFGISMFIVMINFMTGVNDFLENSAFEGTPDLRIYGNINVNSFSNKEIDKKEVLFYGSNHKTNRELNRSNEIIHFLNSRQDIRGMSPQITTGVIFLDGENQVSGTISGVNFEQENHTYNLYKRIIEGKINNMIYQKNGIIIGKNLSQKLNLTVGNSLEIITTNGKITKLPIIGVFSFGISLIDNVKAYVDLNYLRKILNLPSNYVTEIHIKLNDHYAFNSLSIDLKNKFTANLESWQEANKTIITGIKVRNTLTWVVSFAMLLVAGFGIYNIMNMSVMNKVKEIAVLKSMGFASNEINYIFLTQSIIIGVIGSIIGIILGFFLCIIISKLPLDAGDFLSIKTYPMNFEIVYYFLGAIFGIITTILAGFLPARKASKVDPVTILRGL